jgi:hypothetical protein
VSSCLTYASFCFIFSMVRGLCCLGGAGYCGSDAGWMAGLWGLLDRQPINLLCRFIDKAVLVHSMGV